MDSRNTSVEQLAHAIRTGEQSAEALMRATLDRIDRHNPKINAFIAMADKEGLFAAAASIDKQVSSGRDPGPLAGIPVGVKDLEDTEGLRTTFGSALYADAEPARREVDPGTRCRE